jgi:hypothetical protein
MMNLNKKMVAVVFLSLSMVQAILPANPDADTELEELSDEAARHYGMTTQDLRARIDIMSAQASPEQKECSVDYSPEECKYLSERLAYNRVLSPKEIYEKAQERIPDLKKWFSAAYLDQFKKQFRLEG